MFFNRLRITTPVVQVLVAQAFLFAIFATFIFLAGSVLDTSSRIVAFAALTILFAITGSWICLRPWVASKVWERRLSTLAHANISNLAFESQLAAGSSEAEHGWNRLIEMGRSSQSLQQVYENLNATLVNSESGDYLEVLDSLSDAIAVIDSEGTLLYKNSVMSGFNNATPKSCDSSINIADVLELDQQQTATLLDSSRGEVSLEIPFRTNRSEKTIKITRSQLDPNRMVCTARDVTQQRLAEAMRERFLSTATHEFRAPLANIRAYAESLDMGSDIDSESRKHFYNIIQSEAVRLSQLVDDLLDISRIQAGALALELHETDLARLVDEVIQKVHAQSQEKEITFSCELSPKLPKVMVDKGKLCAALVNLLNNAVKYTPVGGKIGFRVDQTNEQLQFTVTDSGIGISAEELPNVFERFFRSSDDRVRDITGSGLGLPLSQEVARLHGGDITVESELNQGSCFCLFIPIIAAQG